MLKSDSFRSTEAYAWWSIDAILCCLHNKRMIGFGLPIQLFCHLGMGERKRESLQVGSFFFLNKRDIC